MTDSPFGAVDLFSANREDVLNDGVSAGRGGFHYSGHFAVMRM